MSRIGNVTGASYSMNYNTRNKLENGIQHTLKRQDSEVGKEIEESLNDKIKKSRFFVKDRLYMTNGEDCIDDEAREVEISAPNYTAEDVRRDYEFITGVARDTVLAFPEGFLEKISKDMSGIKVNYYMDRKLNGYDSLVGFNELIIGEGSKINLEDGYSIQVFKGRYLICHNNKSMGVEDTIAGGKHYDFTNKYEGGIANYLYMLTSYGDGNITSMWLGQPSFKGAEKDFLQSIGIDTTKPFTINGTQFKYNPETGHARKTV